MRNDKNIKNNNETKICKCCGRELPLSEYIFMYGKNYSNTCKQCINKKREQSSYEKGLQRYLKDDSMHTKRLYKTIDSSRILRKKDSGIDFCARDEKFVRLLYYKDAWISNYSRCIIYEDGEYRLLHGSIDKWSRELIYTLKKERYVKSTKQYKYVKRKVTASSLVVDTFIVNYDMTNNTHIWHLNNDTKDGYYKHLYPVTEKQYNRLTELQQENIESLSEDVIMEVINAVDYKQDGWNPYNYRRSYEGKGCQGMKVNHNEPSYLLWKNVIQRCYNRKIHKYKPEYKDKSVCEEWQNYANFKIWYDEHYVPDGNNQLDLDKDLLVQGNKVYSPETCVFLLHYQNTMFERSAKDKIYEKEDGTFVIGGGKKKTYATLKEAEDIVCERNQNRIESVAEKCKGSIPMCAYEAMLNWDVRLAMCG